jgi:hypothetical protein
MTFPLLNYEEFFLVGGEVVPSFRTLISAALLSMLGLWLLPTEGTPPGKGYTAGASAAPLTASCGAAAPSPPGEEVLRAPDRNIPLWVRSSPLRTMPVGTGATDSSVHTNAASSCVR